MLLNVSCKLGNFNVINCVKNLCGKRILLPEQSRTFFLVIHCQFTFVCIIFIVGNDHKIS